MSTTKNTCIIGYIYEAYTETRDGYRLHFIDTDITDTDT